MATKETKCDDEGPLSLNAVRLKNVNNKKSVAKGEGFNDEYGFTTEELYKLALKFYKDKEGTKALQISYSDRLKLVALTKQISYGKFRADIAPDVGILDVIGNDRRQVWQSLGDMSQHQAMNEFLRNLIDLFPQFTAFVKTHKAERDQLEKLRQEEEEQKKEQERQKILYNEMKKEEEKMRSLKMEQQIKDALNQQTAIQFKQYAKQQAPDSVDQQESLVMQLQEQHFQQYMQQVHDQMIIHQRQQYAQLQTLVSNGQTETDVSAIMPMMTSMDVGQQLTDMTETDGRGDDKDRETDDSYGIEHEFECQSSLTSDTREKLIVAENVTDDRDDYRNIDEDDEEDDDHSAPLCEMPPLIPATIWTRKNINEFKEAVRKNPENVIRVGSLSTATVRVPTHENGTSIFFEFATDSYDLGFGMYFEWTLSPPNQVTVQISESSDEEDLEEEEGEGTGKSDVEKGSSHKKENGPPTDEIIQIYRRDCHEEVYCGSHVYPGRGVYLLKFDNSYSLWRSKTVYYRIFYSR